MAKRHMKKCSGLLAIREVQIKTTMMFHLIPVRITTQKFKKKVVDADENVVDEGILIHCW